MTKFYTRWTVPLDPPSEVGEISMTAQEFRDESDINQMFASFLRTGVPPTPYGNPQFVDAFLDNDFDYTDAVNRLGDAYDYFYSFPSDFRDRYQNDPAVFFDAFRQNPSIVDFDSSDSPPVTSSAEVADKPEE